MSYAHVTQIPSIPLPPGRRAVLTVLADMANAAGVCWPCVQTIAHRACMSVRSVFAHLKALEGLGVLMRRARIGRSSLYTVTMGQASASEAPTDGPTPAPNEPTTAPEAVQVQTPQPAPEVPPVPAIAPPPVLTVETVVQAMRRAGLMGSYECGSLAALVASASPTDGVSEFTEAASEATKRGKGFAWALARVKGQRADRAALVATVPSKPGRDPVLIQLEQDAAQAVPVPLSIRERLARLKAEIVGAVAGSTAGAGA